MQRQQQASNTTATCNASIIGAHSSTTTAVQQYVQHTQAADAGQSLCPPPVSFFDGRVLYIVERIIPGTRYELYTHTYLKNCISYHMYTRRYDRCDVPRKIDTRRTYKEQENVNTPYTAT